MRWFFYAVSESKLASKSAKSYKTPTTEGGLVFRGFEAFLAGTLRRFAPGAIICRKNSGVNPSPLGEATTALRTPWGSTQILGQGPQTNGVLGPFEPSWFRPQKTSNPRRGRPIGTTSAATTKSRGHPRRCLKRVPTTESQSAVAPGVGLRPLTPRGGQVKSFRRRNQVWAQTDQGSVGKSANGESQREEGQKF